MWPFEEYILGMGSNYEIWILIYLLSADSFSKGEQEPDNNRQNVDNFSMNPTIGRLVNKISLGRIFVGFCVGY